MRSDLPEVRGSYRFDAPLGKTNWFGVGGNAEVLFKPEDTADLAHFLKYKPQNLPLTVIGVGSNLIVRDGGIEGVVIRLGRGFTDIQIEGDVLAAGAAAMDVHVANFAAEHGRAGLEFLSGIPGTIGGALAMNAGAYGRDMAAVLLRAEAVTPEGEIITLTLAEMHYAYRHYGGPTGLIFTRGWLQTTADDAQQITARIAEIKASREATQPIRERTGGSTFKNPDGAKAWELIDKAGCRGLQVSGAQMSELHCNFMINTGGATAADLENLGEEVCARVLAATGMSLEWEIRRIGRAK